MRKLATTLALALLMGIAPVAFAEPPSNDDFEQAEEVTLPFSDSTDTSEATTELGEPTLHCETRPTQNTIWYKFTATETDRLFIDTLGSDFDTVIVIYVAYDDSLDLTPFDDLAPLGCEDPGAKGDEFSLWVESGYTYYFQVGGHIDVPSGIAKFNVKAGGSVSGRITDSAANGLEDICVYALQDEDWGHTYYGFAVTDDAGNYRVRGLQTGSFVVSFYDCGYGDTDYESEFYNNKKIFDDADPVSVVVGEATTGIDAALAEYIPPPPPPTVYTDLALSDLQVTNVPIHTDYGEVGYSGYLRQIDAEVSNLSTEDSPAFLRVRACESDGDCSTIHRSYFTSKAGSEVTRSFRWNALGWAGDVSIQAEVCTGSSYVVDTDSYNNTRSVDHYVMVGGIGKGYNLLERLSPWYYDDYYYDSCGGPQLVARPVGTLPGI